MQNLLLFKVKSSLLNFELTLSNRKAAMDVKNSLPDAELEEVEIRVWDSKQEWIDSKAKEKISDRMTAISKKLNAEDISFLENMNILTAGVFTTHSDDQFDELNRKSSDGSSNSDADDSKPKQAQIKLESATVKQEETKK